MSPPSNSTRARLGWGVLSAAPIVLFYSILILRVRNLPCWDDYWCVLQFLQNLSLKHSLVSRVAYILSAQHNEYKLIFENILLAAQYGVFGGPNFAVLSILGDLFVLPIAYLIWKDFLPGEPDRTLRLRAFVPVTFLLFQLQYAETLNWSSAGLQNFPVILFSLACIQCLANDRLRSFAWACTFLALAVASSGNGLILPFIGLLMLIERRKPGRAAIWLLTSALMAILYFWRYQFAAGSPHQQGGTRSLLPFLEHIAHQINPIWTLSFIGSCVSNNLGPARYASLVVGSAILIGVLLMYRYGYHKSNPALFYFALFILLTAIAVSGLRSQVSADFSRQPSRYKIYSDLLVILLYASIVQRLRQSRINIRATAFQAVLAVSIVFCAVFDVWGNRELRANDLKIEEGISLYQSSGHTRGPMFPENDPDAVANNPALRVILRNADSSGLYRIGR
jgi:hypothetical protein